MDDEEIYIYIYLIAMIANIRGHGKFEGNISSCLGEIRKTVIKQAYTSYAFASCIYISKTIYSALNPLY